MDPLQRVARLVFRALPPRKQLALRSANQNGVRLARSLGIVASADDGASRRCEVTERIVILGAGPAAFTLVQELARLGYQRVSVVSPETAWGGTCVRVGCMPMAHLFSRGGADREARGRILASLVETVRATFENLPCTIVTGTATAVLGRAVLIEDGRRLEFDRVVLALGADRPVVADAISLEAFWSLTTGRIAIVSDGNPASVSLASAALRLGLRPTLVLTRPFTLGHLPSFAYFVARARDEGVEILGPVSWVTRRAGGLSVGTKGGHRDVDVDHILDWTIGSAPRFPVDGRPIGSYGFNFSTLSLLRRPDVFAVGATGGFLSASEAELSARLLARGWATGAPVASGDVLRLPQLFHASMSLAMVGSFESLFASGWQAVDFSELGVSSVLGESGKVWFLMNDRGDGVEAIHVCHPEAGELIASAAILLGRPIHDPIWRSAATHPSRSEIFGFVARRAMADHEAGSMPSHQNRPPHERSDQVAIHRVPMTLEEFRRTPDYRELFMVAEERGALLSKNPYEYLLVLAGLKMILRSEGHLDEQPIFFRGTHGSNYASDRWPFALDVGEGTVRVQRGARSVVLQGASL